MKEEQLIKEISNKRNTSAANQLINSYYKDIYIYVHKQINDIELTKDLTQDIFISMLKSVSSYECKKSSFKTWLYRIASNKIIDYYRSKNYKYTLRITDIQYTDIVDYKELEAELIQKEHIEEILSVANKLESSIQQIFRMKIFGDMTFKEIGRVLDLSESTVKTKYYSCINKIKKELNQRDYE